MLRKDLFVDRDRDVFGHRLETFGGVEACL
jgi:hypothetical protein